MSRGANFDAWTSLPILVDPTVQHKIILVLNHKFQRNSFCSIRATVKQAKRFESAQLGNASGHVVACI